MLSLDQGDLTERIHKWVEDGGVWVVGPMSDIRSSIGTRFTNRPYNSLEAFAGVRQAYEAPDRDGLIKTKWNDGKEFVGKDYYELFEADEDALATVTEGYPTLTSKATIICKKVGKGKVYILGTIPSSEDMAKIISLASADAGVSGYEITGTLIVSPRKGDNDEGLIVAECNNSNGSIVLKEEMTDVITGKKYSGKVELSPYDVLVLKK